MIKTLANIISNIREKVSKIKHFSINQQTLIMDDITSSGETIEAIIKELDDNGIHKDNIFSMALVADKDTHKNKHIPDYYWKMVKIDEYKVPWGKTIINKH